MGGRTAVTAGNTGQLWLGHMRQSTKIRRYTAASALKKCLRDPESGKEGFLGAGQVPGRYFLFLRFLMIGEQKVF